MTIQDVNQLLAIMKANYSYAFKAMSPDARYMLLGTWAVTLQDLPADVVMLAVMQLVSQSKWMPTVAEIREKCREMRLNDTHSYIHYCFMKAAEIKDIPSLIQGAVFDVFKNRPDWIEEYKKATSALAMPRGAAFFKALNAIPTWEQQLSFLTGESVEERIEIIRLIGRAIQRFNVDGKTLADMVRPIYPSFADYISMNDTGVEGLSHYFQQYKRHKLANTLPTDPEFLLGLVSTDNFDYRACECLHEIGELLHTCKTVFPFEEDDYDDYDGGEEDKDDEVEDDDLTDLHPNISPATNAEFSRMLDLTDNAISREHMSRLAANTGKPKRAALMHEQSEKLWHEAFRSMCKYVAMSHDDTISHIMQEL